MHLSNIQDGKDETFIKFIYRAAFHRLSPFGRLSLSLRPLTGARLFAAAEIFDFIIRLRHFDAWLK